MRLPRKLKKKMKKQRVRWFKKVLEPYKTFSSVEELEALPGTLD